MHASHILFIATLCVAVDVPAIAEDKLEVVKLADIKWSPCDPKASQPDPCQVYYFRGNPEKEANYSYFRVPKGHIFSPHWHTGNGHLVVAKGVFVVGGEKDSKGVALRAGDYAYEPAKWIHWGKCTEIDCIVFYYVDGPDSYIDVNDQRP
jgi:quercetin dioxygenase-like cupin family protein